MLARPPRRPAPMPTAKTVHLPAPVGGLNSIDGGSVMAPTDGVLIYNMIAGQNGIKVRPAFQFGSNRSPYFTDIRSVYPFTGSKSDGTQDRLFVSGSGGTGNLGIQTAATGPASAPAYTAAGANVNFTTVTGNAGYGTCVAFNTSADRFLVVCDEVNGMFLYTQSTDTWAAVTQGGGGTQISGVNPANFAHVTVFKNRLWFTQKDTTLGWYLGTNAVFGAATSFDFGPRMRAGGDLRGLFNWSYDGGNGIDSLLVGISGGGDVVIYQGTDPTTAAGFGLKGTWSVSGVPAGRRVATEYGGDLLILSTTGVVPLSRLVVGNSDLDRTQYSTFKITNAFAMAMANYSTKLGWALLINPSDSSLLINVPTGATVNVAFQFVMSLATKAWSQYGHDTSTTCYGYPMLGGAVWGNKIYFGGNPSTYGVGVFALTQLSDASQPDKYLVGGITTSVAIEYEVMPAFQDMGSPSTKVIGEIRPRFLTYMDQTTSGFAGMFGAAARYEYDTTELIANASSALPAATSAATVYKPIFGATGMGVAATAGVRGKATCQTTLVGIDVVYTEGGFQ